MSTFHNWALEVANTLQINDGHGIPVNYEAASALSDDRTIIIPVKPELMNWAIAYFEAAAARDSLNVSVIIKGDDRLAISHVDIASVVGEDFIDGEEDAGVDVLGKKAKNNKESESDEDVAEPEDRAMPKNEVRKNGRRQLQILTSPEHHKMASKLFSSLVDGSNMSLYSSFLEEFDGFLQGYGGFSSNSKMGGPRTGEVASLDEADYQSSHMLIESALANLEIAKRKKGAKSGRAGFLSALMKTFSGAYGDKIVAAWDSGDKDTLTELLDAGVDKVANLCRVNKGAERASATESAKTLYVYRPLLNPEVLMAAASAWGFEESVSPEEMHVTIAYSKEPVDWNNISVDEESIEINCENCSLETLGAKGAVVVHLHGPGMEKLESRWKYFKDNGATWDYETYKPHTTLTYRKPDSVDIADCKFTGTLRFGREIREVLNPDFNPDKEIPHVSLTG